VVAHFIAPITIRLGNAPEVGWSVMAGIVGFAAVSFPELSVVCVAGEQRRRVERCLGALATQTAANQVEVIVVDLAGTAEPIVPPSGLSARGKRMAVEPDAVVSDECFESLADVALANHVYSEMLAVQRARANGWSVLRRILYALGSPLGIPAMRLALAVGAARRSGRLSSLGRAIPGVAVILVMAGLGEARGYLGGTRNLGERFLWRELNAPRASR
jgi:hypothetical protein